MDHALKQKIDPGSTTRNRVHFGQFFFFFWQGYVSRRRKPIKKSKLYWSVTVVINYTFLNSSKTINRRNVRPANSYVHKIWVGPICMTTLVSHISLIISKKLNDLDIDVLPQSQPSSLTNNYRLFKQQDNFVTSWIFNTKARQKR